jgi:hypothetical protein
MRLLPFSIVAALAAIPMIEANAESRVALKYAPAAVDNPLKGLVPYEQDVRALFPHSLEFNYLPYSALVKGYDEFDWKPLDEMLDRMASRGHQAVLRIFLEYPKRKDVIPEFLIKDGLKVTKWLYTETHPLPHAPIETPDYENANLRKSMKNFIAAFGKKYDRDPRIGFVTAGLLGAWGEWHNYQRNELFASKTVQAEVMDAYEAAFKNTPVLMRYPVGEKNHDKAPNDRRKLGYHDDSFAWATLDTGKKNDSWFYMAALKAAGPSALDKWKTQPIGGEIRPEAWSVVFDDNPGNPQIQNFRKCVETTHATWLMDSGMFKKQPADRVRRAEEQVRRMGYEFHAPTVSIGTAKDDRISVTLEIENRGVAPFYRDWPAEWALLQGDKVEKTFVGTGKLTDLLPGDKPRQWSETLNLTGLRAGKYTLAIRIANPMKGGKPIRFANETQNSNGWLSLGTVEVP